MLQPSIRKARHGPENCPPQPLPRASRNVNRSALIEESFELAAGRCEDLTPLVYARLFREHPDMLALFGADTGDQVKGEMLAKAIQGILDFIGEHHYAAAFIRAEAINHAGFQVPPAVFSRFFRVLAATLAELLGPDWSPEIAAAWEDLLSDLDAFTAAQHSPT
jgi:hemoglobin-like flavoprotein